MNPLKLCRVFLVVLGLATAACTAELKPQSIIYGKDSCEHCHMTISDQRFGGQIVTKKGKHFSFDSVNCLHHYLKNHDGVAAKIYFVDSVHKDQWIESSEALFKLIPTLRSPMGAGIFSLPKTTSNSEIKEAHQLSNSKTSEGTQTWDQLSVDLDAGKYK